MDTVRKSNKKCSQQDLNRFLKVTITVLMQVVYFKYENRHSEYR